ncbi:MAG: hypothetical protein P8P65_03370 [Planktotalea sp.]|uniref:hypothetical protein n=1 Tax=Planktotalea sp. TaxID=2029877 RepID=UPI0012EAC74C|nr:hypothetical protein [Planktotalea sp.]MDG1075679.1 hypothetical protein [Planktotalea sp.]MDG1083705.1 hypothetical protein [Planktotalea sp.]
MLQRLALIAVLSLGFTSLTFAQTTDQEDHSTRVQIPIIGDIDNPEFLETTQDLGTEIFSHEFLVTNERKLAVAIAVFVGPDVVSDGQFIQPQDLYMDPRLLEIMSNKVFPDTGCRIERLWFENSNKYFVLLIESSEQPQIEYLEQCLLGSAMTALGEELDGNPIQTAKEMRTQLDTLVETLK